MARIEADKNIWTEASDGKLDSVRDYLAQGIDVNVKDENGYTPLIAAVSYNHLELAEYLVEQGADVNLGDNEDDTPLHACETKECAEFLIKHGANADAKNSEGQTPLDTAEEDENDVMIEFLKSLKV